MMNWIVGGSLQARFLVVAVAAGVIFFGVWELRDMPVDTLPEFAPPSVEVQTEALGLSAAEVEQLITVPLEADLLNGVPWLDVIRSESVPGLSSIELIFEPGTDVMRARQMVQERLTEAHALPNVSRPPVMLQPVSSTGRVMMVGLSSEDLSLIEMSVLARWTIRPRLIGVPGVANVAIWAQREQQLQVQVDPERLREYDVSLDDVIKTAGNALWVSPLTFLNASTPGTGGFIDTPNQRLGIQHILPISSPSDLAQVTIEGSQTLRLGDVATLVEDHQPLIGDAIVDGGPGLLLVIEKFPGANTLAVTRAVEEALEALRPGLTGVEIDSTIYRPATSLERGIDDLTWAVLISLILVILALGILLFEWRAALISLLVIPLSLVAAGLVLSLSGATFNIVVFAGLVVAVGIVVDDSIIDTQNMVRRLRQRKVEDGSETIASTIFEASLEMRSASVYATLIILLALMPLFFMDGVADAFFPPLAVSYALAVLSSMLVALTVTPALGLILFSRFPLANHEPRSVRWLQRSHGLVLSRILDLPRRPFFATLLVVVLVGLAAVPLLRQPSLIPSFKQGDLLIQWDGAPGTSHPEMVRITTEATGELRSIPGVRDVGALVGRAVTSDRVVGINSAELWVSIDPAADYGGTVAAVEEVVDGYPGLSHNVVTYLEESLREVLTGADEDIVVRVYGEDLDILRSEAEQVRQSLSKIDGVVEPRVEILVEEPTLEIEVDLAAAQRFGVKPGDVRRASATMFSGIEVGSLFEEQKVFEVVVWSTPETRHSLTSVLELPIDSPSDHQVLLGDVAEVRIVPAPNVIKREAVSRRIDVFANVEGRDIGAVAGDIERALREIEFPLEYHAEVLGGYADGQATRDRVLLFAFAAAIGIFLLLQAAFGSWRLAILTFLTLPISLVGAALAAAADGGDISLGSIAGFFVIMGLATRNGMTLISHYQHLEKHEGEAFGPGLVLRGSRDRIAPTLATALATGLALVPLLLFGDIFGHEIVRPMAIVILGGLITSTLFSLFILPALYLRFAHNLDSDRSGPQMSSRVQLERSSGQGPWNLSEQGDLTANEPTSGGR